MEPYDMVAGVKVCRAESKTFADAELITNFEYDDQDNPEIVKVPSVK